MLISTISKYQSMDFKHRPSKAKPHIDIVSKTMTKDTYKTSTCDDARESSQNGNRDKLLKTIKKKIDSGFYHSKGVLEDLSNSFAEVFNKTL